MPSVDYVNNPNQRTPCVLVLDASGSMGDEFSGSLERIDALNEGIKALEISLKEDPTALSRVQLAIVSVGGPNDDAAVLMDWTDCINFEAFSLSAGGGTPLGEGLVLALDLIEEVKDNLKKTGISYTRPWIMVISDGAPTSPDDVWLEAVQACQKAQASNKVEIFSIAVKGANLKKLGEISTRPVIAIEGLKFRELFVWLTASLSAAAKSRPGDKINLPSTDPWRNVGV